MTVRAYVACLLILLVTTCRNYANDPIQHVSFADMEVIRLVNGSNEIDLNGDGIMDTLFWAWRGNQNAHGYNLFTFYIHKPNEDRPDREWHLVPFNDEKGIPTKESVSTISGADCVLQDIRVLRSSTQMNAPVIVIIGAREFGESYADVESVKFVEYELKHNTEGIPLDPPFHFAVKRTITGKRKHCDINTAFLEELGVVDYEKREIE